MPTHHSIDYIEFAVLDLPESRRFYSEAFGWGFTEYGPDYVGITIDDREVGGMHPSEEIAQGGPLVILYSDNLEDSLAAVVAAGGEVVVQPFDFPGGRRFHFEDPSGNELAVWSKA